MGVAAGLFGTRVFKNDKEMISSAFNRRPSQRLYPGVAAATDGLCPGVKNKTSSWKLLNTCQAVAQ